MMTRTIKQVSPLTWVQIKEDARYDDDFLLKTCLEEVEAVGDGFGETFEVEPEVECGVGDVGDAETHVSETFDHVVTLVLFRNVSVLQVIKKWRLFAYSEVCL
jgi:hypothetical protein